MDKLKELYQSYVDNGLLSKKTSFEEFSSANSLQLKSLYDLGVSNGILSQQTDIDTFSSAWEPLKKKESSESTSQEEPVASATEIGSLEPQGSAQIPDFTALRQQQQVKQYGELPAQNESRLSPEAKKKVDERISAGEVQAAPAKKPESDQKPAPKVSEYLQALEREEFNRINSVRSAINNAELELQDKTVDKSLSESFNMGWGPRPNVKTENSQAVQDARKKQTMRRVSTLGSC
jgi:hypothetical protein